MLERVGDKVRLWELNPPAPAWVHTVEAGCNEVAGGFVTVWVCSPLFEPLPQMAGVVGVQPEITEHDAKAFHAEDVTYAWVEERYGRKPRQHWRQHYHWRFAKAPTKDDIDEIFSQLGPGALSPQLLGEIDGLTL